MRSFCSVPRSWQRGYLSLAVAILDVTAQDLCGRSCEQVIDSIGWDACSKHPFPSSEMLFALQQTLSGIASEHIVVAASFSKAQLTRQLVVQCFHFPAYYK